MSCEANIGYLVDQKQGSHYRYYLVDNPKNRHFILSGIFEINKGRYIVDNSRFDNDALISLSKRY